MAEKQPNEKLTSWFVRSGWSKGELARQVNRRARQLGAHHVSTDTSRVRRWLDGEQPREPIPRILSELFSERFGSVVAVEDLGLRTAAPVSGGRRRGRPALERAADRPADQRVLAQRPDARPARLPRAPRSR